ncbi:MAG TPA: ATP-binding protein [Flavobacteriales bacterium]|nr:ATP-binding protein [Flavobacteriales bacterium]
MSAPKSDKLKFKYLPDFASFLLENKLAEYVKIQLEYVREEDLPLFKLFKNLPEKELFELAKKGSIDFLKVFIENRARVFIEKSAADYVANRLPAIEREQIVAKDITSVSVLRRRSMRAFLPVYTNDMNLMIKIMEELDYFLAESESVSFNAFIQIQQEKIQRINLELESRNADLVEAQELSNMGSFFWDFSGKHSVYSTGVLKVFEIEQTTNLSDFLKNVHPDDRNKLNDAISRALNNDGIYECEYRYFANNKEKRIWSRGVVSYVDKKPVNMKGTLMDVTHKYSMLQSMELKNRELQRINKELQSFNYVASHDLQEPLRKIQLFTHRILEKGSNTLEGETVDYFNRILVSASRMQKLIEDLLTFSQTTADKEHFKNCDLSVALEEALASLAEAIKEKSAKIITEKLPEVRGLQFQLTQLFLNLIGNALKYAKEDAKPTIKISVKQVKGQDVGVLFSPNENYIELCVQDNGIGFDQENAEKIFGLFQRLHTKEKYSGTGIGLAICKKIMHNHEGFIKAESVAGVGSIFKCYFPV